MRNSSSATNHSRLQKLLSGNGSATGFRWFVLVLLPVLLLLALAGQRAIAGWDRAALNLGFLALLAVLGLLFLLLAYIRQTQLTRLRATQQNMVFGLANLAEMRDPDTGKHLERTRGYGVILADTLRRQPKFRRLIDDKFIANLYDAAPLHDLGKVGVPDRVLLKPGRLDQEEFAVIQSHATTGARILERLIEKIDEPVPFLLMSHKIALHHHEKYNGSGYPAGLAGEDIPLEARIYALGDAYDAIRAKRPYKAPVTHLETVQRIYASRGTHFDPDIVNAFLDCEEHFMELFDSYQVYDDVYLHRAKADAQEGGGIEPAVVWSREFELGLDIIDRQHRELIERINSLLNAVRQGKGREESMTLLRFLQEYVIEHFRSEEIYMRHMGYQDYETHKEMHDTFVADLHDLTAEVEKTGITSEHVVQINKRVINWVVAHIFLVDKNLRDCRRPTEQ
ncbi:bacteriohemerythrin [Desulfurivibrio alkaliphilus]|uniref:Metal dependent phosphohydrolase n=1 Tax=Desulfurivibrio alkaliphilus (strain DSM 19089 / UNIQEM U267 / AHT2) TaxID=589865 RepID=D6Z3T1_DESAT|nr:bacteriohemerythrin [Desulfurivibrio alkaliphilus]ADH86206.1 metal dependent phosphohydrolase [Desulfurivibrio alkaliphilus AHT 2]